MLYRKLIDFVEKSSRLSCYTQIHAEVQRAFEHVISLNLLYIYVQ